MSRVPILLYHSIADEAAPRFRPWTVSPELFAAHMDHLAAEGYRPVTVSRLEGAATGNGPALPEKPVLVTFDDGFADFHTAALPVLERHGFPATLYVTSGYVGRTARWLEREGEGNRRMLTWAELQDVAERGVEVGAHSHTHPKLDEIGTRAAKDQIVRSRHVLEDHLQRPMRSFAYPHGYHGPRVRQQVVDAGFCSAAAVRHAMSSTEDDVFGLARIIVHADTTVPELDRLLQGHGLPQAPYPARWRTGAWRAVRRGMHAVSPGAREVRHA